MKSNGKMAILIGAAVSAAAAPPANNMVGTRMKAMACIGSPPGARYQIRTKLGVASDIELVRLAPRHRIIAVED